MTEPQPKRRRRWYQFSLRTLFVVITLLAVWLGIHTHSARLQKRSVAAVHEYGGRVRYDFQYPQGTYGRDDLDYSATSRVPQWMLDSVGIDFFHDVVEVTIDREYDYGRQNPSADDGLIRSLYGLPELRRLGLSHCGVSDEGLRGLSRFSSLEDLDLSYSSITDDALSRIGSLTSLKWLDLGHTRINGRGFHRLSRLDELEVLILTLTPIRDEALNSVKDMEGLQYTSIHGCRHLTPGGVEAFRQAAPKCKIHGLGNLSRHFERAGSERLQDEEEAIH